MTISKCESLQRLFCRRLDMVRKPDSAEAFLIAAATSQASCLVTDIQLGDISGVELVHQLAADGYKYPTIFITALDDEWIKNKAVAAGGTALLTKPFPSNVLMEAIVKAIG
jgi:FixJ family two-component response regulator